MTQTAPHAGRVVVVFGSTGTGGSAVVDAALADPSVSEVRAFTRRPLGKSHPKLSEVLCTDFGNLRDVAHHFRGVDACLFCLGTSVRNVPDEEEYRQIHVAYPLVAARTLLSESPGATFIYLSGAGASRTSWMMWARVKAEAEDALEKVGLARHANVRPTALLPGQPRGAERWVIQPLVRVFPALGIRAADFGRAAVRLALDDTWRGSRTLESAALKKLL